MSFTVDVQQEDSKFISIETSFLDTIETVLEDVDTDTKTLAINNNNYNTDFEYTKNIIDIVATNTASTTNLIDVEIFQTYDLTVQTSSTSEFIGNIHYTRVDGLEDFIEHGREFDCGTP
tara:strand:- start:731 stop:1087 length:357 start_codon:yes stop_codon:yes gene_type:complete